MGNVTKKDLVEEIANRTGLTQVDTKIVVETFFESIAKALGSGRKIEIRGFGRFKVKEKRARMARNPHTGEAVHVKASMKPVFDSGRTKVM